jgi:hypothetical protein
LAGRSRTLDAFCAIKGDGKQSPLTEINEATAPFTDAEIKENQAALIRQMVAVGVILCLQPVPAMVQTRGKGSRAMGQLLSIVGTIVGALIAGGVLTLAWQMWAARKQEISHKKEVEQAFDFQKL